MYDVDQKFHQIFVTGFIVYLIAALGHVVI